MRIKSLFISAALATTTFDAFPHGPASMGRSENHLTLAEAVDVQETGVPVGPDRSDHAWGVTATTGWESRHVHYGVDESGSFGAYVNDVGITIGGFSANVWNGFGLGNGLVEWDFTAAYNFEAGPVFVIPGYNLRYVPHYAENGHTEQEHAEHGDHGGEQHGNEFAHAHKTYGNELFVAIGTTVVPYVTPSATFLWDLNTNPGGFLEFRLDGEVPVYEKVISLQPYALLGVNLGYNTTAVYGLNNFQTGLQATCRLCAWASVFAGVNYSIALAALEAIGQDNVFWVNAGLSFAY